VVLGALCSQVDLCPVCIDFTDQALQTLVDIIANGGIVGGCQGVCSALGQKTGSQALGAVCDLICTIVGIDELVKILDKADLDPIYFCELAKLCPINDHGDAKITMFTVAPPSGPQGTTFTITCDFTSQNGTGTGEIDLFVATQDGVPLGDSELLQAQKPGNYGIKFNLQAQPDPSCDPTQEECEQWLPGNYTVQIAICNGECGSKHPHSQIYDSATAVFNIVG
jgi:hypothetical protein